MDADYISSRSRSNEQNGKRAKRAREKESDWEEVPLDDDDATTTEEEEIEDDALRPTAGYRFLSSWCP